MGTSTQYAWLFWRHYKWSHFTDCITKEHNSSTLREQFLFFIVVAFIWPISTPTPRFISEIDEGQMLKCVSVSTPTTIKTQELFPQSDRVSFTFDLCHFRAPSMRSDTDWRSVNCSISQCLTFELWSMSDPHRDEETIHVHVKDARFNTCSRCRTWRCT